MAYRANDLTTCHHHPVILAPAAEDLLVLYYPDKAEWMQVCTDMISASFVVIRSFNPYWDINGCTFVDSDGYYVVISNKSWSTLQTDNLLIYRIIARPGCLAKQGPLQYVLFWNFYLSSLAAPGVVSLWH